MKHSKALRLTALSALVALLVVTPSFALNARAEEAKEQATTNKEAVSLRLEAKKLEVCEKHQARITSILDNMVARGTKQYGVFDKIVTKTLAFAETKNITVDPAMIEAVNAAKPQADAAIDATENTSSEFGCNKNDPKGTASQIKEKLKAQISALKEYKTAVKNLIVSVKSSQSSANDADTSTSDDQTGEE